MDTSTTVTIINLIMTCVLCLERFVRNIHPHLRWHTTTDTWSFGAGPTPDNTPTNRSDVELHDAEMHTKSDTLHEDGYV